MKEAESTIDDISIEIDDPAFATKVREFYTGSPGAKELEGKTDADIRQLALDDKLPRSTWVAVSRIPK